MRELGSFLDVVVYDPVADREDALHEYGVDGSPSGLRRRWLQAVVLALSITMVRSAVGAGAVRPGGLISEHHRRAGPLAKATRTPSAGRTAARSPSSPKRLPFCPWQ